MIFSGPGVWAVYGEVKRIDRDRELWARKFGHKVSPEQFADTMCYFNAEQVKMLRTEAGRDLVAQVCAEVEKSC